MRSKNATHYSKGRFGGLSALVATLVVAGIAVAGSSSASRQYNRFDSIHAASMGARNPEQVKGFVVDYVSRTIRTQDKKLHSQTARAVLAESKKQGFDPILLLAVINNESRFNPSALGRHGEIGLMQLKPKTAEWVARKSRIHWNGAKALKDPAYNIRLGAAYLSMLRRELDSKDLYLAAYNMGIKNVRRILSAKGRPEIYVRKTVDHYAKIYAEFEARVMAKATAYAAL